MMSKTEEIVRFLIVDDEESICETLTYIFEEKGYNVESVNTGKDAIEKLKVQSFHAALIDIMLPDMNGMDVLKKFKTINPELVCIIITGNATLENAINALEDGADGYFIKPARMQEVMHKLMVALEKQQLRREIKESEAKYKLLFENANDAVFIMDALSGIFLDVNNQAEKLTGYSKDELMQKNVFEIRADEYINQANMRFKEVRNNGSATFDDVPILNRDGRLVQVEISAKLFEYQGKAIIQSIVRDVTERKKVEKELKVKDYAISSSLNAIVISDPHGFLTYVNKSCLKLWGYEFEDDLIGKPSMNFWKEKELGPKIMKSLNEKGNWRGELKGVKKNGTLFDVDASVSTVLDDDKQPICIMASFIDVTERKKALEDLAKARDSLAEQVIEKTWNLLEEKKLIENIINTISDGILVLNRDGKLSLCNEIVKKYCLEVFDTKIDVGYDFSNHSNNVFNQTVNELFHARKSANITIEPKEGLFFQFVSMSLRTKSHGAIIEIRDVTPFIEFDNMRKKFVSTASHELRTPISVILQSLRNIEKYRAKMSQEQYNTLIMVMLENAELLSELINDLLIISRFDENRVELEWSKYKPSELMHSTLAQMEPPIRAKNITINLEIDDNIQLYGDSKKISQIFRIFIDNAIKYSNENSKIEISMIEHYQGKYNSQAIDGILFKFRDYGIGIHKWDIPNLFKRFFRSADVQKIPGTGLGLHIARELTRLHKGDTFVDSVYGKGSTFFVFLPKLEGVPRN